MWRLIIAGILAAGCGCSAQFDARQETVRLIEKAGLEHLLSAPVRVCCAENGPMAIIDEGIFMVQHTLLTPAVGSEPNVVVEGLDRLNPQADKLFVAVHGWLDKGQTGWPGQLGQVVYRRVDPNEWVCASFDWKGGAVVVSSVMAAEYARDVAGPRLAAGILAMKRPFTHIHLVGHSAGSWAIHSAARRLAERFPESTFHLTFLDAYVPGKWNPDELGTIFLDTRRQKTQYWGEHYYTRDITYKVTECHLKNAHNVDITKTAPILGDHEFPYRWYIATVTGEFERWGERGAAVLTAYEGVDYGFARSLEAADTAWQESCLLPMDNPVIRIHKQ